MTQYDQYRIRLSCSNSLLIVNTGWGPRRVLNHAVTQWLDRYCAGWEYRYLESTFRSVYILDFSEYEDYVIFGLYWLGTRESDAVDPES